MAQTCTICRHARLRDIDQALIQGDPVRAVASRYVTQSGRPVSHMALFRHKESCLPAVLVKAAEQEDVAHAIDLAQQLFRINAAAWAILDEARQAGRPETALRAIDRVVKTLEVQVKITETQELEERITALEAQRTTTPSPQGGARSWR